MLKFSKFKPTNKQLIENPSAILNVYQYQRQLAKQESAEVEKQLALSKSVFLQELSGPKIG